MRFAGGGDAGRGGPFAERVVTRTSSRPHLTSTRPSPAPTPPHPTAVRTDGPPFVDLKAKQGKGFEDDYDKVQKYLGPGKVSAAHQT